MASASSQGDVKTTKEDGVKTVMDKDAPRKQQQQQQEADEQQQQQQQQQQRREEQEQQQQQRAATAATGAAASGASGLVVRVLVVEDDTVNRTIVCSLLKGCGYDVVAAADGREAIKLLSNEKAGSIYSLVLCDIMMPKVDGKGVLTFIRNTKELEHLPVVMMSALDQTPTVFDCIKRGADDYILKPVTRKEVKYLWAHVWRRKNKKRDQADGSSGKMDGAGVGMPTGATSNGASDRDAGGNEPEGDGGDNKRKRAEAGLSVRSSENDMHSPSDMREYCERQILKYQRMIKLIEENPNMIEFASK